MKTLLAVLVLAGRAQADRCEVAIASAPDDVRAVVESWLAGEHCAVALEVRITRGEQGLAVVATDSQRRVRERVVPDAESAGVLIASWAAADALPGEQASVELEHGPPAPVALPVRGEPRAIHAGKTIAVTAAKLVNDDIDGAALRGELDVLERGSFRGGIALAIASAHHTFWRGIDSGDMSAIDTAITGYVAHVASRGAWQLRSGLGIGLVASRVRAAVYETADPNMAAYDHPDALGVYPTATASVGIGYALGSRWLLETGPFTIWLGQHTTIGAPLQGGPTTLPARGWELAWFAGVRRAL